jgi:uncharacterized protein (PEP-CTERM system associated)
MALLSATPANAQLLPETGTTVQVGALRQQLEGLFAAGTGTPTTTPGWTITPAIGVEERWTDHLQGLTGQGKSTFITALLPSVLVNGQTVRTNTTLSYAPELDYYSGGGTQNRINQNLNATSQITLVAERLFLDLRGFAAMQPVSPGYGPAGTVAVARQDETQTMSFSAHPYLRQHFGDFGTAELGAMVSRTSQDGLAANQLTGGSAQTPSGLTANGQNFLSEQEYFSLTSGPDFGRTSAGLSISASQNTGSGVMNNAHRDEAVLNLGYAITRNFTALASLGYQDIHYGGVPPFNYSGMEWNGGGRWVPNPDSTVTLTYGRRDGGDAALLDASYALTARTRVFARYSQGLASGLEQLLNGVNGSTLDPMGNPVDRNGTPVQLDNTFYGTTDNVARVTNASVTVTLLLERDSVSATLSRQQRHQVAAASAATAGSQDSTGLYGSLNWQRDLWPNLSAASFVQWGTNRSTAAGTSQNFDSLVFSLSLAYVISETLRAYGQYSWTRQTNAGLPGSMPMLPANLFIVGARKTF